METNAVPVDPGNQEQLRAWDGAEGAYWAAHPDQFEQALDHYDDAFFAAAAIGPMDRVLDIGCGTGKTTRRAAVAAAGGSVLGVDLSSAMIETAERRAVADGLRNVRFEQVDAQIHAFTRSAFDIAIGRTSVTFFGDRVAGLSNVGRALRPGGRLVLLNWQPLPHQEWIREFSTALAAGRDLPAPPPNAPGPFTLAEPDIVNDVLIAAGYADITVDDHRESMRFGADTDDAYQLVLGLMAWMLEGLDDDGRARAQDALRSTIAAHRTSDGVVYDSAAWIVRATRP